LANDGSFAGDAGGTTAPGADDIGNSGDSYANSVSISTGGIIAIVVVVVAVSVLGGKSAPAQLVCIPVLGPFPLAKPLSQPSRQHSSSLQRGGSGRSRRPSEGRPARWSLSSPPGGPSSRTPSRTLEDHLVGDARGSQTMYRQPRDFDPRTLKRGLPKQSLAARPANGVDEVTIFWKRPGAFGRAYG
jgi:hypothetical protein